MSYETTRPGDMSRAGSHPSGGAGRGPKGPAGTRPGGRTISGGDSGDGGGTNPGCWPSWLTAIAVPAAGLLSCGPLWHQLGLWLR